MFNAELLKPNNIDVALDEKNPNRAVITLEPFERGYGHTLGNALRRILLASMVGYAPTEAEITGIVHEYSQIEGVMEDAVDAKKFEGTFKNLPERQEFDPDVNEQLVVELYSR